MILPQPIRMYRLVDRRSQGRTTVHRSYLHGIHSSTHNAQRNKSLEHIHYQGTSHRKKTKPCCSWPDHLHRHVQMCSTIPPQRVARLGICTSIHCLRSELHLPAQCPQTGIDKFQCHSPPGRNYTLIP